MLTLLRRTRKLRNLNLIRTTIKASLEAFIQRRIALDPRIERIQNILKEYNYKITEGRKEIIEIFVHYDDRHLKVNTIYDLIKDKISLPTVYRTIEILKHTGIINEIVINEERYYELKIYSRKCFHIHFKCDKCNTIYDCYDSWMMVKLLDEKEKIEKQYNTIIYDIVVILNGVCNKCRR